MDKEQAIAFMVERFGDLLTAEDFILLEEPGGWEEVRRRLSWRVRQGSDLAEAV